jgi:hypothetical protein
MSVKSRLRTLLLCCPLVLGSLMGVNMRPEEIEERMSLANRPKIAHVLRQEKEDDEELR